MTSLRTPSYRLHKPSGQAVVTLDGQDRYLGKWNSPESRAEYDRLIAEWLSNGRRLPVPHGPKDLTIDQLILAFWQHAEQHYSRSGKELDNFKLSLRPLRQLYGSQSVRDFGPKALKAVQQRMIDLGWCRNVINRRIARVKTLFRWGESEELVPAATSHALRTVVGISKGRRDVRQTPPVKPAVWEQVEVVAPLCTRPVGAMLLLQWWSGMRSCEVRIMRTCDIDRTDPACWLYRPVKHKNDWREGDLQRVVPIGPECQRVLEGWLRPNELEAFLFEPRQAVAERNAKRRSQRRSPMTPSQQKRRTKRRPKRTAGDCYSDTSYAHAVANACKKAGVKFHPYALRHGCKMRVERFAGTDAARTVLGQRSIQATQHYGQLDLTRATEVMGKLG